MNSGSGNRPSEAQPLLRTVRHSGDVSDYRAATAMHTTDSYCFHSNHDCMLNVLFKVFMHTIVCDTCVSAELRVKVRTVNVLPFISYNNTTWSALRLSFINQATAYLQMIFQNNVNEPSRPNMYDSKVNDRFPRFFRYKKSRLYAGNIQLKDQIYQCHKLLTYRSKCTNVAKKQSRRMQESCWTRLG